MDMLIDLAGPGKWEPISAMEKAKGKAVGQNPAKARNALAQIPQHRRANVELMIEGLAEC